MRWARVILMSACLVIITFDVVAAKRIALVIGNSEYLHTPVLANPANDAADMTAKLRALDFEVIGGNDLTLSQLRKTIRDFADRLENADIGLFFYAGHGVEVDGQNYILPIDAKLEASDGLRYETMPMESIHLVMERKARTALIFLDACRDNPLARSLARTLGTRSSSIGRGLAQMGAGVGTLIAYATQPGNVALDGDGRNSPFTSALLQHLGTPGEDITISLRKVRSKVLTATGGAQVPWENSSLTGEVILKAMEDIMESVDKVGEEMAEARAAEFEIAYWNSIRDADDASFFRSYLDEFPEGRFVAIARLKIARLGDAAAAEGTDAPAAPKEPETPTVAAMAPLANSKLSPEKHKKAESAPAPPVRQIQTRLNELGCDAGPVDGVWGPRSAAALARFESATGAALSQRTPSTAMLASFSGYGGRVCPTICADGFIRDGEECLEASVAPLAPAKVGTNERFDGMWRIVRTPEPGAQCGDWTGPRSNRVEVRGGQFSYRDVAQKASLSGTISPSGEVVFDYAFRYEGEDRSARLTGTATIDADGHGSGVGMYRNDRACVAMASLTRLDGKSRHQNAAIEPAPGIGSSSDEVDGYWTITRTADDPGSCGGWTTLNSILLFRNGRTGDALPDNAPGWKGMIDAEGTVTLTQFTRFKGRIGRKEFTGSISKGLGVGTFGRNGECRGSFRMEKASSAHLIDREHR